MSEHYPPRYNSSDFHCIYCNVYAKQTWCDDMEYRTSDGRGRVVVGSAVKIDGESLRASFCSHCNEPTLWLSEKIIFPSTGTFPTANSDLPDDVKRIYAEAGAIAQQSPRAACALLRLAIEILLNHLGEKGSISQGIRNLVQKKGLDPQIEQALEIVRVTGNNAVHPGKIVFNDISDVKPLFDLINIIAEVLITRPMQIQGLYNRLPGKKQSRP